MHNTKIYKHNTVSQPLQQNLIAKHTKLKQNNKSIHQTPLS